MTKRNGSNEPDYAVGYGRPPKETRFQPGKSGNPTGRGKGNRSVGAILDDVFRQKIEVTENGKTRRVAAVEAMMRRLRNDALRGDPKAIRLSIELIRRRSDTHESAVPLKGMLAEDQEILAKYFPKTGPAKKEDGGDPYDPA